MRICAVFPQTEIGVDPVVVREFACTAESLGYSRLAAYDHVLGAHPDREPALTGPYTHEHTFHEPFVLFGHLAALTTTIELMTHVLILPQRQTVLAAKQAAEVDLLSGGRLRLGVGVGWNPVEYEALDEEWTTRGRRVEEQIEVMRALWSEPLVDYTGEWHRIDRACLNPRPDRPIPVWFGGFSDVAYRRAARLGDGFLVGRSDDPAEMVRRLRGYVADAGRDPEAFGIEATVWYGPPDPQRWRDDFRRWEDAGADLVAFTTMRAGITDPIAHVRALEEYWEVCGPLAS